MIWMVRTKISNVDLIVVHFFGTPQKSEPKKTRVRALPLRIPMVVACYTQKTLTHFLLNTRGFSRVQTLLSPLQRRRRKRRDFYGKKIHPVGVGASTTRSDAK